MSNIRRARKVDANQAEIVKALKAAGAEVHPTNNEWDLTIQVDCQTMLIEVRPLKSSVKGPRKGRQANFQRRFLVRWVRTPEDAIEAVRVLRLWGAYVREGTLRRLRAEAVQRATAA